MSEMNVENTIQQLRDTPDLEDSDRLMMFVSLCDADKLIEELKHQAVMIKMGMATETLVHSFAYGILKIVRPDLLEVTGGDAS